MKSWLTYLAILLLGSGAVGEDKAVIVGAVLPLSGRTSNFGIEALRGINLAVEKINDKGGVRGQRMTLVVKDNAGDPI